MKPTHCIRQTNGSDVTQILKLKLRTKLSHQRFHKSLGFSLLFLLHKSQPFPWVAHPPLFCLLTSFWADRLSAQPLRSFRRQVEVFARQLVPSSARHTTNTIQTISPFCTWMWTGNKREMCLWDIVPSVLSWYQSAFNESRVHYVISC